MPPRPRWPRVRYGVPARGSPRSQGGSMGSLDGGGRIARFLQMESHSLPENRDVKNESFCRGVFSPVVSMAYAGRLARALLITYAYICGHVTQNFLRPSFFAS